jgi:glycerol uptake facilitator-like aquaporin
MNNRHKDLVAEFLGTAMLVCVVVASGIMGTNLSADTGIALIINAISTVLALGLLIWLLGPISGAHFNPAVTMVALIQKQMAAAKAFGFIVAQILGGILGSIIANTMFDLKSVQISTHERVSTGTLIGEVIATAGLQLVIHTFASRAKANLIPLAVPAWIGTAYFFTSSTSFANPAVTVGRIFSNTFAGIAPSSVLPYIAAQLVGAVIGFGIAHTLSTNK